MEAEAEAEFDVLSLRSNSGTQLRKSNKLVHASFDITLVEYRVLQICISKIKAYKSLELTHTFKVHAYEYAELFNVSNDAAYLALREAADKLIGRYYQTGNKDNGKKVNWLQQIEYKRNEGTVALTFSPLIAPLLTNFKRGGYTTLDLQNLKGLASVYSIRMYEMLKAIAFHREPMLQISVDEFRYRFQLESKYIRYSNLRARVIKPAIDEINKLEGWTITLNEIKKGRAVTDLYFRISEQFLLEV